MRKTVTTLKGKEFKDSYVFVIYSIIGVHQFLMI